MILLQLFLTFLKIGATTFGGGYAMIPIMREEALAAGWLTEEELLNFIGVAESTPGPIAINMATFVGSSQAGILGAILATLGVILPSFVVILLIVSLLQNFIKYRGVQAALRGIRPVVVALILTAAITMGLPRFTEADSCFSLAFNLSGLLIFAFLALVAFLHKRYRKKPISPILLILLSAAIGVAVYL